MRILIYITLLHLVKHSFSLHKREVIKLKNEVHDMFYHAYDSYIKYAYPYDELRPLTCDGHDTWGSYSLTLIDALDTLAVMGNASEFQRVASLIGERIDFDIDINVSVFETNIRIVGGLLSAHLMSRRMGVLLESNWPCDGPLLRLAVDAANRLLPAFDTPTGLPYGTVNLRDGVPENETPITCTAGAGTFIIEFGTLSRLTGDPLYEEVAMRAIHALWSRRSIIDLIGNHIDVITGKWTAHDAGIGAGVDSFFEYLVKGASLLQRPELMAIFNQGRLAFDKYLMHDDWHLWATMNKGHVTMAVFQSLQAYYPGVLTLVGDISAAQKIIYNYHQVWKQFGFTPEFYNIAQNEVTKNREGYPLRPELAESLMYLYQATKDDTFQEMAADIVSSIQHSAKTKCGYATVKNVLDHSLDNSMESFFLAETAKYLYLIFDQDHWLHNTGNRGVLHQRGQRTCVIEAGGYIYNTEAHPVDPGALACCLASTDSDMLLSLEDQVSLILNPLSTWDEHKGQLPNERKENSKVSITENIDASESSFPGHVVDVHKTVESSSLSSKENAENLNNFHSFVEPDINSQYLSQNTFSTELNIGPGFSKEENSRRLQRIVGIEKEKVISQEANEKVSANSNTNLDDGLNLEVLELFDGSYPPGQTLDGATFSKNPNMGPGFNQERESSKFSRIIKAGNDERLTDEEDDSKTLKELAGIDQNQILQENDEPSHNRERIINEESQYVTEPESVMSDLNQENFKESFEKNDDIENSDCKIVQKYQEIETDQIKSEYLSYKSISPSEVEISDSSALIPEEEVYQVTISEKLEYQSEVDSFSGASSKEIKVASRPDNGNDITYKLIIENIAGFENFSPSSEELNIENQELIQINKADGGKLGDINNNNGQEISGDEKPRIHKQEVSPRFSSLSETVERSIEGNTSEMEGAGIYPSVSSSKYTITSGTAQVSSEPLEEIINVGKKEFVLENLIKQLMSDKVGYQNFTASFSLLSCPHPPFTYMLNIKGQMFNP